MHRNPLRMGLILAACLGMSRLSISPFAWAAACIGPSQLEARVRANPNADSYAELGAWFVQNHSTDCAVQAFQSGLKLDSSSAQLNYLLGLSLYKAGRMQEAVAPLQQYARLRPEELNAHLLFGTALSSLGRNKEAFPEWEAALKIDPTSKKALEGLASALIAAEDYESVISRLRSAPRDENLTLDLAIAYGKLEMFDDAAQVLTGRAEDLSKL